MHLSMPPAATAREVLAARQPRHRMDARQLIFDVKTIATPGGATTAVHVPVMSKVAEWQSVHIRSSQLTSDMPGSSTVASRSAIAVGEAWEQDPMTPQMSSTTCAPSP